MKKEKSSLTVLGVMSILLILSVQLVSAQNKFIDISFEKMKEAFASIFGPILGVSEFDEFLFAKVLILFLIFAIVFMVLSRIYLFKKNKPVIVIVSVIVSILSVRYLKENELITGILLPYGGLGAAITIFLPLLIYFIFVHTSVPGTFARRAAWFIYGAAFLILWGMREVSEIGIVNWVYTLGIGFITISFIFDHQIHKYFGLWGLAGIRGYSTERLRRELRRDMQDLDEDLRRGIIDRDEYRHQMRSLRERYSSLEP